MRTASAPDAPNAPAAPTSPGISPALMDKLGPCVTLGTVFLPSTARAQRAYRLNQCFGNLRHAVNRERFAQDADAYLRAHGLSEAELALVAERAYVALLDYGVSTVALAKLCRMQGVNLVQLGAAGMRLTPEAFLTQRKARNEGQPWQF